MTYYIKPIRNESEHKDALLVVEELMKGDLKPDSENAEKLEILSSLIADYESRVVPESLPDPIDAILFRMDQQGLSPSDLIPFIGSRSKVSEVLSRKRPLTLSMIRSLETGLGIPAKVLVKEADEFRDIEGVAWGRFPEKEMAKRGYFKGQQATANIIEKLKNFLAPLFSGQPVLELLRKSNYRFTRPIDKYALAAWTARVIEMAKEMNCPFGYRRETVNLEFMTALAKLSALENGPLLVRDALWKNGIVLIFEPHFKQTYLDGATLLVGQDNPIIGLTIRHDRVDNFWFTLMHELAHLALHCDQNDNAFYDDLDGDGLNDGKEREADSLAGEALVPMNMWEGCAAKLAPTPMAAVRLAREIGVHVAIVAGKIRHAGWRFTLLNQIVNQAKVRHFFEENKNNTKK